MLPRPHRELSQAELASHFGLSGDTAGRGESRQSMYVDADEDADARSLQLELGAPILREAESMVPLRDVPAPNRAAMVDVVGGSGIPSMHGSVGYFGRRQSGLSGHTVGTPYVSELGRAHTGGAGDGKGKGRDEMSSEFGAHFASRPGSARTRLSVGSR